MRRNSETGIKDIENSKYKLLCPRGTQTCALAVANIAHAVYLLDVAKRPIPQG